jgi:hypothetical protein
LKKIIVATIVFVACISLSIAQNYPTENQFTGAGLNQPTSKGAWLGGATLGVQTQNSSCDFELNVKGNNVYSTNRIYVKQGNLEFKNYAHGSGQIDNEVSLQTYHKNLSIANYPASYITKYGEYTDEDTSCIQFKEDNSMVYSPMRFAIGTGYYSIYPINYNSLIKEKTWIKNYRAATSMHHQVEYAHALDKELEVVAKEYRNVTYDPYWDGLGVTQWKINEDVTDGTVHIGILQASETFASALATNYNIIGNPSFSLNKGKPGTAWYKPTVDIDLDYVGSPHIEMNTTIKVPYTKITGADNWLPCCFGGWNDMYRLYQAFEGPDAGTAKVFDCSCGNQTPTS